MQSSYSLIKKERALSGDSKRISTKYINVNIDDKNETTSNENFNNNIEKYEEIAKEILASAEQERELIIADSVKRAEEIEKEAYEKGYSQGRQNGYEDGKNEAIESILPKVKIESQEIIQKAERILQKAESDYKDYIEDKQEDILRLSVRIAEQILKSELIDRNRIVFLIEEAIKLSKGEENIIIKCNELHEAEITKYITIWKTSYSINGEIFILPLEELEPGNAIIEKNNGQIKVGIDAGLEKIEEVIFGKKCE